MPHGTIVRQQMTEASPEQRHTLSSLLCTRTTLVHCRPEACDLIATGRLSLLGEPLSMHSPAILESELPHLCIDGEPLHLAPLRWPTRILPPLYDMAKQLCCRYYALNKPRGVLTARQASGSQDGKRTITDVLRDTGLENPEATFSCTCTPHDLC